MEDLKPFSHPRIETKSIEGVPNGYLIPVYNDHESPIRKEQRPCQVYLTVVAPGAVKGPHLHMQRWGLFTCIKGNIKIVVKTPKGYKEFFSGENHSYQTVQVPAGWPSALQNQGDIEAFVLNMPSPAWTSDNQDDHPVVFADYKFN
jgi:dTDP-4-dehydrorhamnose 3,5-epimerase-like enzyme